MPNIKINSKCFGKVCILTNLREDVIMNDRDLDEKPLSGDNTCNTLDL